MEIKLYEFGLDNCLGDAEACLRDAIYNYTGKKDEHLRLAKIGEAFGLIQAARQMIDISNPE